MANGYEMNAISLLKFSPLTRISLINVVYTWIPPAGMSSHAYIQVFAGSSQTLSALLVIEDTFRELPV